MDAETLKKEALEGKLSVEQLVLIIVDFQQQNERLQERVDELERELGRRKPEEPKPDRYSLQEQERQEKAKQKRRKKQKSLRRGRRKTKDKIVDALREENVFPDGCSEDDCEYYRTQLLWHIEAGQAVSVSYRLHRGPSGEKPLIDGSIGRSEFGVEIFVAVGYLTYVMGLSIDKVCELLEFFWKLKLSKSQADALLNRLGSEWEPVFDDLCELLANANVVHADETSWSINSVWTFISSQARLLIYGVHKDANTLLKIVDKNVFAGTIVSDNAAVYQNFSKAQKCWAHLIRKAFKLTLARPDNEEYRQFLETLVSLYRRACGYQKDRRLSPAGRTRKVEELTETLNLATVGRIFDDTAPVDDVDADYVRLVNELSLLGGQGELFTFVENPEVPGTNNISERELRDSTTSRKTNRTSKTISGARRRTTIVSVLQSLRACLSEFTLHAIIGEIKDWQSAGVTLFRDLLTTQGVPPPTCSKLDALFPA
jgi:transposase